MESMLCSETDIRTEWCRRHRLVVLLQTIFRWNGGFLAGPVTLMSWETSFPQLIPKHSSCNSRLRIQVFCWPVEITTRCNSKCQVMYFFGNILEGNAFSLENLKKTLRDKITTYKTSRISSFPHCCPRALGLKTLEQVACSPRRTFGLLFSFCYGTRWRHPISYQLVSLNCCVLII